MWLCPAATPAGVARCQTRSGTLGMLRTGGATTGLDMGQGCSSHTKGRGQDWWTANQGDRVSKGPHAQCVQCSVIQPTQRGGPSLATLATCPCRPSCSCGELCGKPARGCRHPCVLLCHPGQAQHRGRSPPGRDLPLTLLCAARRAAAVTPGCSTANMLCSLAAEVSLAASGTCPPACLTCSLPAPAPAQAPARPAPGLCRPRASAGRW